MGSATGTARRVVRPVAFESEQRFRALVTSLPDLVLRLGPGGDLRSASQPEWRPGSDGVAAIVVELQKRWAELDPQVSSPGQPTVIEWRADGPDGPRWYEARVAPERLADGSVDGVVAVVLDRTDAQLSEARLRRDPLTGLGNRTWFLEALTDLLASRTASGPGQVAVVVADLEGFSQVNTVLGHQEGDRLLREIATRLQATVPPGALVARIGADEFGIAAPLVGPDDAPALGRVVLDAATHLAGPVEAEVFVAASAGVAMAEDGLTATEVIRRAGTALHAARDEGGSRCLAFESAHRGAAIDRQARRTLLQRALHSRSVVLHYQPVIELATGRIVGVEALVRLQDDDGTLVAPDQFIPLAEETGLDVELGALVLDGALGQLAAWRAAGAGLDLAMSVNVTARQLGRPGFVHHVLSACRRHGIDPTDLALEITETLVVADPGAAAVTLQQLRTQGIRAVVDDFGVGYSSISYLRDLPVDVVKVDRSFVAGLPDGRHARAIVSLVVGLAGSLDLAVTAEGIETEAQRDLLGEMGCGYGQGFLFSRPVPAEVLLGLLRSAAIPMVRPGGAGPPSSPAVGGG